MKNKTLLLMGLFLLLLGAPLDSQADVELNGYTFPADSPDLFKNPFYNEYQERTSMGMVLYGYGDFTGHSINHWYNYTFTVAGIECAVMFEEGYYPTGDTTFRMDYYQGYFYYARDIEDNIHILQMSVQVIPEEEDGWNVSWVYTDLSQVGTTLLYPSSPASGQEVFGGHVDGTGISIDDVTGCMTIAFDSHPMFPSKRITRYLAPGIGVYAEAYNWGGKTNGYSRTQSAPGMAEEEQDSFEKFTDKHCFISACSL